MIDGCLVVYKPKGITSHDVINKIRRVYKQKKCGHAGTLDPMAQGVLLVFFGKALKLINFIPPVHLDQTPENTAVSLPFHKVSPSMGP